MGRCDPTCHYYEDAPCARPKECPVHGPVLRRPTKTRHTLRDERERPRWIPSFEPLPRTRCGMFLYLVLPPPEEYGDTLRDQIAWRDLHTEYRRAPIPSTEPDIDVYYAIGCDRREVLVVQANPTCRTCARAERARMARRLPKPIPTVKPCPVKGCGGMMALYTPGGWLCEKCRYAGGQPTDADIEFFNRQAAEARAKDR